jgi:serpin B
MDRIEWTFRLTQALNFPILAGWFGLAQTETMRRKEMKVAILITLVMAMLTVTSCGIADRMDGGRTLGMAIASEKERVLPEVPPEDLSELVEGNTAFAFDLYRPLAEQQKGENLLYSPYSISLALVMTYAGARGETEEQMAHALRFTLPDERLHAAFNALDQELAQRGKGAQGEDEADRQHPKGFHLNIANAIWGQESYAFLNPFLDTLAANYGAGLRVLDFARAPEDSRVIINDWISQQTEGRIEDLIPQGTIDRLTRLVLTNAVYFNAPWAYPFRETVTEPGAFTLLDGSQVVVPMMRQAESLGYAEGEGYQAVELPYDGREMSMVIILPESDRFDEFESSLDGERVQEIVSDLTDRQVALKMPTFEFDSHFGLSQALEELGMPAAFSSGAADFSGMTGTKDLFISDVLHKAFVSVDEEGTEAAAATVVEMEVGSEMPADHIAVDIDHPFIFLIRDIETNSILFVGRVLDPGA